MSSSSSSMLMYGELVSVDEDWLLDETAEAL
jgi:hypothetical protein